MKKVLLVAGNVIDGLSFIGPFDCVPDAIEWAEENNIDEYSVGELYTPEVNDDRNE